jgi:hypothetical protein
MCDYAGLTTCGCRHCRERFSKEYGHEIPPFGEKSFWGDIIKPMLLWGNYENPAFRDWIRMKADIVADHVKLVKEIVGSKPLLTCCSSTGPIVLNSIALNLEKMAPHLDMFMLENVGTNIKSADWVRMDAEALQQKDIAGKRNNAPALALSYTIYEKGGYLGWALSRFWGVANWSSTLNQRLEEDPADAMEIEDIISLYNNWEKKYSDIDYRSAKDFTEVRLVSSSFCRDNGYRYDDGKEQWNRVCEWSQEFVKNSTGYRIVRSAELADLNLLQGENTPLVIDGVGCVSDAQNKAVKSFINSGGRVWLRLPFGTHDEKGYKRKIPLSDELKGIKRKNLVLIDSGPVSEILAGLIGKGMFLPAIRQISGDKGWSVRIHFHQGNPVFHFMNTSMIPVPHPHIKDNGNVPILKDIDSAVKNNKLAFEIDSKRINLKGVKLISPEIEGESRPGSISILRKDRAVLNIDLDGIKVYATGVQEA